MLYYPHIIYVFVENMWKRGCSARTIAGYLSKLYPQTVKEYNLNYWKVWRIIRQLKNGIVEVKNGRAYEGAKYVEMRNERLRSFTRARLKPKSVNKGNPSKN
jgi:hypothetical protein